MFNEAIQEMTQEVAKISELAFEFKKITGIVATKCLVPKTSMIAAMRLHEVVELKVFTHDGPFKVFN